VEKLSARKRDAIVRDYLSALSYSEIAKKQHVSTGTVANVVADLKAGGFPEAGEIGEQIEQLKELSLDLKRANLTPGRCALGLMVLTRINECGLDPSDIDRWPLILKAVQSEDDAQKFVQLIYGIQGVQKRTGLSLDALYDEVHELEKKAADLKPMSDKVADCKKQVAELTGQRKKLSNEVGNLEEKHKLLTPRIKELERREKDVSRTVAEMEPRTQKAEEILDALSVETQKLQNIGFTCEKLAEFSERVKVIAERYDIAPEELRDRLLQELERLDEGIGMEALINCRQQELAEQKQLVAKARQELETTKEVVNSLKQEKTKLEASIKGTRERVSREIVNIIPIAKNTVAQMAQELRNELDKAKAEVSKLRDESLEVGKEMGRYEEILKTNAWLNDLMALVKDGRDIEARKVKAIALSVLRGFSNWLKAQDKYSIALTSLSLFTNNLIREMEQWKV
jgi:predicted  nucleic acid-binding Zn-ribbon protein